MSISKTPRARKRTPKGTGSGRKGKVNGAPIEPIQPPGVSETVEKPQPPVPSVDLKEFQARLDDIRKAIIEAIEAGFKLAAVRSGSDLADGMTDSATTGPPEVTYPPTTQGIKDFAAELLHNPELWFNSPNPRFNGRKPIDMLGTEDEIRLYWALSAYDAGLF